jgi:hypothetical protein
MEILARSRALPRAVPPPAVRDRGDGGLVVLLTMALVFAPVVGLHVACLALSAGGAKPVAASVGGDGGARG